MECWPPGSTICMGLCSMCKVASKWSTMGGWVSTWCCLSSNRSSSMGGSHGFRLLSSRGSCLNIRHSLDVPRTAILLWNAMRIGGWFDLSSIWSRWILSDPPPNAQSSVEATTTFCNCFCSGELQMAESTLRWTPQWAGWPSCQNRCQRAAAFVWICSLQTFHRTDSATMGLVVSRTG